MKESILKKMKEKGLKLTPQRLAIVDAFVERTALHPGARLIHQEAKKRYRGLSFSTVYLTLKELSRHGIIKTLEFDRMENRFDGNIADHINLICKRCRKIMDYQVPPVLQSKELEKKAHFRVTETRLEYYGYCSDCRKKSPARGR
jgi:Fur family transcriptional regulator, peroxide stress response regulator